MILIISIVVIVGSRFFDSKYLVDINFSDGAGQNLVSLAMLEVGEIRFFCFFYFLQKVCIKKILLFFVLFALKKHKRGRAVKTIVLRAAIVN